MLDLQTDVAQAIAREAAHLASAIAAAPLRSEPSPHVYIDGLFSDAFYDRLERAFPTAPDAFQRWNHGGDPTIFFGNYDRRHEINFPHDLKRLTEDQRVFWSGLSDFLCGPAFARIVIERFRPFLRERFGDDLDDPSFFERKMRGAVMLDKHDPGYYLGPHTDRYEKIVTCVFFMAERPGLDHLGTALYRPLEEGFTCRGIVHHDPKKFAVDEVMPFRPNSAFIFARSDVLFHGVEPMTEATLQGSSRPGFQMQFWER